MAVFVLFFLQLFLTVVPFVNASAETNKYSDSPGNLAQNHNTPDTEENNCFNYSEVQECHFSIRSKRSANPHTKSSRYSSLSSGNIDTLASNHYSASSSFVVTPAYYTFLSLHKLF